MEAVGVRDYSNVTLHVAYTDLGCGKASMTGKKAKHRVTRLLEFLKYNQLDDSRVFVCHHKANRWIFDQYTIEALPEGSVVNDEGDELSSDQVKPRKLSNIELYLGHYGALDGLNDFRERDTAVIFGLPYLANVWTNNIYFAIRGLDKDFLNTGSDIEKRIPKYRSRMKCRQMAVQVIQAINRAQCRHVIDEQGNCQPTNVYIVLPKTKLGPKDEAQLILGAIRKDMPNIKISSWDFELEGAKSQLKATGNNSAILSFMLLRGPGEISINRLQCEINFTERVKKKLQRELRDKHSNVSKALLEIGVRYEARGRGRGAKSYLVKQ